MRKIILFVLLGFLLSTTLLAQETGDIAAKNAGNAAYKAKNYAEAFTQWEKYLKSVNFTDKAVVFNAAFVANKAKNYAAAEKYYEMSIKNNYKPASAYLGKANAEEDLGKEEAMLATLEAGIKATGGNVKLTNKYGKYFLNNGVEAQKAGKMDEAIASYLKATTQDKEIAFKGYSALASLYFNEGAKVLEAARGYANTRKEEYAAEKEKAMVSFKKALEYAQEGQLLYPDDTEISSLMSQIKEAMK